MGESLVRVVSWNIQNRGARAASRLGVFLAHLAPDLVLLQEVNRSAIDPLCAAAGLQWFRSSVDLRRKDVEYPQGRRLGVAICGRGKEPTNCFTIDTAPLPERTLVATVPTRDTTIQVASYHAPPGVSWHILKARQAVEFARFLEVCPGPVVFGADANTPELDAIDFANTRTHWHSGKGILRGEPGDDLLFGPDKIHDLDDALRRWLADRPGVLARIAAECPEGPLALSHRTGRRKDSVGTDHRFDSVWVSRHFRVENVEYPYDASCAAGSDHSAVVADLSLMLD